MGAMFWISVAGVLAGAIALACPPYGCTFFNKITAAMTAVNLTSAVIFWIWP